MARTRAAKPAAEDASPAAVGKLLTETRRKGNVERGGIVGSASSRVTRRLRKAWRQARGRGEEISCRALFSRRVSGGEKEAEQEAVVWVRRSDWERVIEKEEFVGRFRLGSRFPQYLSVSMVRLMWGRLKGSREDVLDDCYVHWGCCTSSIDLVLFHCSD